MSANSRPLRIAILAHSTNPRGGVVHAIELADRPHGVEVAEQEGLRCATAKLGEQMVANMAKLGIKLTIKRPEHAVFSATTGRGDYSGMGVSQIQLYDPDDFFSADLLPGTGLRMRAVIGAEVARRPGESVRSRVDAGRP